VLDAYAAALPQASRGRHPDWPADSRDAAPTAVVRISTTVEAMGQATEKAEYTRDPA